MAQGTSQKMGWKTEEEDACWEIVFSRLDRDAVLKKYQQNGSREANVL